MGRAGARRVRCGTRDGAWLVLAACLLVSKPFSVSPPHGSTWGQIVLFYRTNQPKEHDTRCHCPSASTLPAHHSVPKHDNISSVARGDSESSRWFHTGGPPALNIPLGQDSRHLALCWLCPRPRPRARLRTLYARSYTYIKSALFIIEAQSDKVVLQGHDWVPSWVVT